MGIEQPDESGARRRAAGLLALLALIAALIVVAMVTLLNGTSDGGRRHVGGGYPTGTGTRTPTPSSPARSTSAPATPTTTSDRGSGSAAQTASCRTTRPCVVPGDRGQAIEAVNAYRRAHGQPSVTGSVSVRAQRCARTNGDTCSGGWVETEINSLDGVRAVRGLARIGNNGLLDPEMSSFEVGWAFEPNDRRYYFAVVHND